jgi:hypothetical protein
MVHITIEYMILIPVLIIQMFLFPLTVSTLMGNWVDSSRNLELQDVASNIGSSMQQVYLSLNHTTIQAGKLTSKLGTPRFIEGYTYTGNATLSSVLGYGGLDSSKVLTITLKYKDLGISTTYSVTLGQNVEWKPTTLVSNSSEACITAEKFQNFTVLLYFGTGP